MIMRPSLSVLSSKAGAALLPNLLRYCAAALELSWTYRAVGGVDAVRQLQAADNEIPVDVAVLDRTALLGLADAGRVDLHSIRDLFVSGTGIAVRPEMGRPDVSSLAALVNLLERARSIAYSTGPSGRALLGLMQSWGLLPRLSERLLQAPAGVPVARLLAEGQAEVGFQQLSELRSVSGIVQLGPMPPGAEIDTVFSAAVCAQTRSKDMSLRLVSMMASADTVAIRLAHGFVIPSTN